MTIGDASTKQEAASHERVCIVGSGNWGSTVAKIIGTNVLAYPETFDATVHMWVYEEMVSAGSEPSMPLSQYINQFHENCKYLPGIPLPPNVHAIPDLAEAAKGCTLIVMVLPHQFVSRSCQVLTRVIDPKGTRCISLIKGIDESSPMESSSLTLVSETIHQALKGIDVSVLMGANIANEVAREQFSEATIGYNVFDNGRLWWKLFHTPYFSVRLVKDVRGVELCGALKNIVALAAGICDGLGYGDNTKAAIMRIGLVEMRDFCKQVFCVKSSDCDHTTAILDETFWESCGVADLITTCLGGRNRRVAEAMVRTGRDLCDLEAELLNGQKLQGPPAAAQVYALLKGRQLEPSFPLLSTIYRICFEKLPPSQLIPSLQKNKFE